MIYVKVSDLVQNYLVSGDVGMLNSAIAALESERDDPSLSTTTITISMTTREVEKLMQDNGSLKLRLGEENKASGVVPEGKLIRVFASDQEENTALIMRATFIHDNLVVLVPGAMV